MKLSTVLFATLAAIVSFTPLGCCSATPHPEPPPPQVVYKPAIVGLDLHGDVHFNQRDRYAIQAATLEWQRATNGMVQIRIVWDFDTEVPEAKAKFDPVGIIMKLTERDDTEFVEFLDGRFGNRVLGITNYNGASPKIAFVRDRMEDTGMMFETATHEFGHALGIHHVKCADKQCIMYPSYRGDATCLTKDDTDEVCKLYTCDRPMNPCKNGG